MKLYWESNSRVKDLVSRGKIEPENVITKTQTHNFPVDATTVRMHRITDNYPSITLHIRGKGQTRLKSQWGWAYVPTCRVNFGGEWEGKANTAMDSNGDLDENLTWLDVHNLVTEAKKALDL